MIKFGIGDTLIYKYKNTLILTVVEKKDTYMESMAALDLERLCGDEDIHGSAWEIVKVIEMGNVEILAVVNTEFDYHTWIQDNPEYFI